MVGRSAFLLLSASCCGQFPRCMGSSLRTRIEHGTRRLGEDATAAIASERATSFTRVPKVVYTTYPDDLDLSEWQKSVTMFAGQAVQMPLGDHELAQSAGEIDNILQREVGLRGAGRAFDLIRAGAWKADLWRYMVLWAYGGVYLDASVRLSKPIEEFVDWKSSKLTLVEDVSGSAYWNAMMASPPKHPALLLAIKRVVENVNAKFYGDSDLDTTGPNMLYRVFSQNPQINQRLHVAFKLVPLMDRRVLPEVQPEVHVVRLSALQKDGAVPQKVADDTAQFVALKTQSSRNAFTARKDHYEHLWHEGCAYCDSDADSHCEELRPCSTSPKAVSESVAA